MAQSSEWLLAGQSCCTFICSSTGKNLQILKFENSCWHA